MTGGPRLSWPRGELGGPAAAQRGHVRAVVLAWACTLQPFKRHLQPYAGPGSPIQTPPCILCMANHE